MGFMRGEALVSKVAALVKFVVFPSVMAASVIYSPPDYVVIKKDNDPNTK